MGNSVRRRYNLTLTESNVKKFKAICKQYNQPPATLSLTVDAMLGAINETFEAMEKIPGANEREPTIGEFLKILGNTLDNLKS